MHFNLSRRADSHVSVKSRLLDLCCEESSEATSVKKNTDLPCDNDLKKLTLNSYRLPGATVEIPLWIINNVEHVVIQSSILRLKDYICGVFILVRSSTRTVCVGSIPQYELTSFLPLAACLPPLSTTFANYLPTRRLPLCGCRWCGVRFVGADGLSDLVCPNLASSPSAF